MHVRSRKRSYEAARCHFFDPVTRESLLARAAADEPIPALA